jgi:proteasome lid subunit RPN8/RPN11
MPRDPDTPRLTFSPRAWLKWQYLCHRGPTEIGAFGLSRAADLLYVEDLIVVKQSTTTVSVAFDDAAVADLFDAMADAGVAAECFARIWLHTHPGASVTPSGVDEETFRRVFGGPHWAVMAILGRTGRTSARLKFNTGPGGAVEIPTVVDWAAWPAFAESGDLPRAVEQWRDEYDRFVHPVPVMPLLAPGEPSKARTISPVAAGFDNWLFGDDPFFIPSYAHEHR